ncbi:MAG: hypothetical protein AB1805_02790 [Nitrospirota bacterium]
MEPVDPRLASAVKEEILRNVVRTHAAVMVEGWSGTGKTVTALKSSSGIGAAYYYSESAASPGIPVEQYSEGVVRVADLETLPDLDGAEDRPSVVIVDDLDEMAAGSKRMLAALVAKKAAHRKIILITPVALDEKELFPLMDAVVRFKQHTAEMLFTARDGPSGS